MANRVCVVDLPGLSRDLLGEVPVGSALGRWLNSQAVADLVPSFPAVTCSVQATLTTGTLPERHGMIANGIPTFRSVEDQALVDASNFAEYRRQISFWEQSNQFLQQRRFWQNEDGTSRWKTALLFFQNCMPGFAGKLAPAADIVLTPKPDHGPDGKLVSLCWSQPAELVPRLFRELGPFPLMNYWGPMASIPSSQWIARAAAIVWNENRPQLQFTYVPHLDYDLQRFGPGSAQAKKAVADVAAAVGPLIEAVLGSGSKLLVLSEYAITSVERAVAPNQLLARAGLLRTKETGDGKIIDYKRSDAVAMVDHQIAHVYVNDADKLDEIEMVLKVDGIAVQRKPIGNRRAGELVLEAPVGAWFDYRWWADAADAPVFAKMVDIHRKPGYDPLELFWDPASSGTSQNTRLVKGSHGTSKGGRAVIAGLGGTQSAPVQSEQVAECIGHLLD